MTRKENIKNLLTELIEMIDNGSQKDLDRADEISNIILKVLEKEPKTNIALERYKDLQDFFSDEDTAKTILENQTEFKAWLERLRWNTRKVDELARKLETVLDKIKAEIKGLTYYWCEVNPRSVIDDVIEIIEKYRQEG